MRIPIFDFDFKLNYQKNVVGDTIWQRFKNVLFDRYIYNKNTGGDFMHYYFTFWDVNLIKVYLPAIPDSVKGNKNITINDIQTNYEDLDYKNKEIIYGGILTHIIAHEYLHYIFVGFGLTSKEQHIAIGKLGIWTNKE